VIKALLLAGLAALTATCPGVAKAGRQNAAFVLSPDGKSLAFSLPGTPPFDAPLDSSHAAASDDQVGFSQPRVATDQRTVGWLGLYANCCTSYPLPRELVLYRGGRVIARIRGNDLPIFNWRFDPSGKRVSYCQRPLHFADAAILGLAEIESGKVIATVERRDDGSSSALPAWAADLDC